MGKKPEIERQLIGGADLRGGKYVARTVTTAVPIAQPHGRGGCSGVAGGRFEDGGLALVLDADGGESVCRVRTAERVDDAELVALFPGELDGRQTVVVHADTRVGCGLCGGVVLDGSGQVDGFRGRGYGRLCGLVGRALAACRKGQCCKGGEQDVDGVFHGLSHLRSILRATSYRSPDREYFRRLWRRSHVRRGPLLFRGQERGNAPPLCFVHCVHIRCDVDYFPAARV